jgi:hypothetical protein
MVIAARGSGEQPQPGGPHGSWNNPAAYTFKDTYYGVGKFNYNVYSALKAADSQLRFSLDPVRYSADPAPEAVTDYPTYEASAAAGANSIVTEIARVRAACGDQVHFVLAGYSQGAWSVHRALYALQAQNDGSLGRISAVVLFGDPEFRPGQVIDRGSQSSLTNSGLATPVDVSSRNVPVSLRAKTASYCLPRDPICQGISPISGLGAGAAYLAYCWAVNWAPGKCPHTSYLVSGATAQAANFASPLLPKTSLWPHLSLTTPPDGMVGNPYSWTATAAPPGSYTWGATQTLLPPGLNFANTGTLTGTPTQAGTYTFPVTATGQYGRYTTGDVTVTINSGGWTAAEAPLPADAAQTPGLFHVACPSSTCAAVGSYADSAGNSHIVVDWGSGSSWTPVDAPLPGDAIIGASDDPGITSEACAAGSSCVLAGSYANSAGAQGLLIAGSGTSWTATKAPVPGNAATSPGVSINSVACPSAAFCVAVGTYTDSSGQQQGLLLTGSGSSWEATQAPLPSNAAATPGPGVWSVACESAASCVAVGNYLDSSSTGQGLLITWSGTSWAPIESPAPGGAPGGAGLQSVACSASVCAAAGLYSDGSSALGLLVSGSGSTWTAAEAPLPADAAADPSPNITSMTCPAASTCVAVGSYDASSGSTFTWQGLLLTGLGSSWTAAKPPLPAGAADSPDLTSVACGSASACVVTGSYDDSSSTAHGVLLTGSGSSWTIVSPPVPANALPANQTEFFTASACPSSSTCVIAGEYTDSSVASQGLLLSGPS